MEEDLGKGMQRRGKTSWTRIHNTVPIRGLNIFIACFYEQQPLTLKLPRNCLSYCLQVSFTRSGSTQIFLGGYWKYSIVDEIKYCTLLKLFF